MNIYCSIYIKGQLGVPLTVYPRYLLCSLEILGDCNPWPYPLYSACIGFSQKGTLVGVHPTIPWICIYIYIHICIRYTCGLQAYFRSEYNSPRRIKNMENTWTGTPTFVLRKKHDIGLDFPYTCVYIHMLMLHIHLCIYMLYHIYI